MKKTLEYGMKSFQFAWKANGIFAPLEVISKVYDSSIYPFIQVYILSKVLDLFSKLGRPSFESFYGIIIAYVSASVLKLALQSLVDVKGTFIQEQLGAYIDLQINRKLSEMDPATFERSQFQDLITQLEGIKQSFQMYFIRFTFLIDAITKFILASIVVSVSFPLFGPVILIATIPSFIAWDRYRKVTWPFYVEKRATLTRITEYIKTLLSSDSNSKESILNKTGSLLVNKIKRAQEKYFKEFIKVNDPWFFKILLTRIFQFCAFLYTQYLNLSRVFGGFLSVGSFALIFQQSLNLVFSSEEILNQYSSISARNKYIDRFFSFFNTNSIIQSPLSPTALPISPLPQEVEFKNVSFKYPNTDRYILREFNLKIRSGEKIALVGENGAGKTTIIKLLLRFYDVTEGEVLINGVNIKHIDLEKWHKNIGALFQDFIKYNFTFKENVYLGDLAKKNEEILLKQAIQRSGASTYLETLPAGFDQVVGKLFDGGIDLSGGQWQKLALARAFYRDAPILILDEPTSSIDAKAEYEIFQNVQKLQQDKTVIIISHRFSTVRHADRILVLDEGRIIEEGNHSHLISKKGLYSELFSLQAEGYK